MKKFTVKRNEYADGVTSESTTTGLTVAQIMALIKHDYDTHRKALGNENSSENTSYYCTDENGKSCFLGFEWGTMGDENEQERLEDIEVLLTTMTISPKEVEKWRIK